MADNTTRRGFLQDVGRGTLVAALGQGVAVDLGLAGANAFGGDDAPARLSFGDQEPLVALLQGTPVEQLIPALIGEIRGGRSLRELVAAAAFANARTFGGEDYIGFHTVMALAPAYHMAGEMPEASKPLPVLKVLYRNTARIRDFGGPSKEVLHPVTPATSLAEGRCGGEILREAVRAKSMDSAEAAFAALAHRGTPEDALNDLLYAVQDNTEVHRTVLPYRAWDLMGIIGKEQAHALLRQSLRYCVVSERDWRHTAEIDRPRTILPKLFDQFRLDDKVPGRKPADDARVDSLSRIFFESTPDQAAEAAAAALAEGIDPAAIGEAITLTANQLVLRDAGRTAREAQPGKPEGSVHGDSIGVHACDSANAWRNMAAVSNPRNTFACLILGAYQVALDRLNRGGDFQNWKPRPHPDDLETVKDVATPALVQALHEAVRSNEQARACALVGRLGEAGGNPDEVFATLLGYAVSEDGALHAEKFYRTVREEFKASRPGFRWRHLVALARVTASEYGRPAPGCAEAMERLKA